MSRLLALCLLVTLTACQTATPTPRANKLTVIATYSILGDWVRAVGGEYIEVVTLVGSNGDAHTFQPVASDSVKVQQAALVFENGLGFEPWLDDLYTAAEARGPQVVVTDGLPLRAMDEEEAHAVEEEHDHGEFDPHVWHDVNNVRQMVIIIRDALRQADPTHAEAYTQNAAAYLMELQTLDAWIVDQVGTVPVERRKLVTTHDTFGYFAVRYGFEVVGTALAAISTEVAEPSAAQLGALVDDIKAQGVPAIFAENVHHQKLMAQIAAEAQVTLAPALYTDALGGADSPAATYLQLMRYNVTTIVTSLR